MRYFILIICLIIGCQKEEVKVTPTCKCPPEIKTPPEHTGLHICAFHIGKNNPALVVETHHYCSPLSNELFQCILYDSVGKNARLLGVEYVISNRLYQTLSDKERQFWHPHEYEIKEGLLIVPDEPEKCEQKLMEMLVDSWGKTIHTWGNPADSLPLGDPILMWSAIKSGQIPQNLLDERNKKFNINEIKEKRQKYLK